MKKNIGNALALYPTPLVVVGAMVDGKPNWLLVGHVGILGHDHVMVSLSSAHYTNKGSKEDKSQLFAYTLENGVPVLEDAPVSMVCSVEDIYSTKGFESFICTIDATCAEESVLGEQGKLDYRALKPVLFEMPTYQYLRTGDVIAPCMSFGKAQA
mgnify:CR=1 FL=1